MGKKDSATKTDYYLKAHPRQAVTKCLPQCMQKVMDCTVHVSDCPGTEVPLPRWVLLPDKWRAAGHAKGGRCVDINAAGGVLGKYLPTLRNPFCSETRSPRGRYGGQTSGRHSKVSPAIGLARAIGTSRPSSSGTASRSGPNGERLKKWARTSASERSTLSRPAT